MKKGIINIVLIVISMFMININVYAANAGSAAGTTLYNELKSNYDKNKSSLSKTSINNSGMVTLYGYSSCNGSSCSINYMGISSKVEEALAKAVTCSNGEKYINYQNTGTGGATDFMEDNKAELNGDAYWSVDYQVTCTTTNTGSSNVELTNTSNSGTNSGNNTTNNGSNSSTNSGSNTTNNGSNSTASSTNTTNTNYNTSSTTNNENTGVNTYFVVLGLVAIISYVFMLCVKKYNLFKNI